jgi:hypothetical protein
VLASLNGVTEADNVWIPILKLNRGYIQSSCDRITNMSQQSCEPSD